MTKIFLISFMCLFLHGLAGASEPRLDLYTKIKKETGVSLKEAFRAAHDNDKLTIIGLYQYARKVGIKEIEKSFEEEIGQRQQYCKKKRLISCEQTVGDLKAQLAYIRELHSNYSSLDNRRKLYFDLIIYHYNIKFRVLKNELLDWDKNCSSQEKINTKSCQEKLFETHVLADIANDIGQVALVKAEKSQVDSNLIKSILDRISRYER